MVKPTSLGQAKATEVMVTMEVEEKATVVRSAVSFAMMLAMTKMMTTNDGKDDGNDGQRQQREAALRPTPAHTSVSYCCLPSVNMWRRDDTTINGREDGKSNTRGWPSKCLAWMRPLLMPTMRPRMMAASRRRTAGSGSHQRRGMGATSGSRRQQKWE